MICVADGMVAPSSEAVPGAAASKIDATAAVESDEPLAPHAAIPRQETASAALKTLIIRRIETFSFELRLLSRHGFMGYARHAQLSVDGYMSPMGDPPEPARYYGRSRDFAAVQGRRQPMNIRHRRNRRLEYGATPHKQWLRT